MNRSSNLSLLLLFICCFSREIQDATFSCTSPSLYETEEGLKELSKVLEMSLQQMDRLEKDIKELEDLSILAQGQMAEEVQMSFLQEEKSNSSQNPDIKEIKSQIDSMLADTNATTRQDCSFLLSKTINNLINDLQDQQQQNLKPFTINIKKEERKIEIIRGECKAPLPELTITEQDSNQQLISQTQPPIIKIGSPSPSDALAPIVISHTATNNCISGKGKILDMTFNSPPIVTIEWQKRLKFGFQFWMRYLTNYPYQLKQTNDIQYISRVTSGPYDIFSLLIDRSLGLYKIQTSEEIQLPEWREVSQIKYEENSEGVWTFVDGSFKQNMQGTLGYDMHNVLAATIKSLDNPSQTLSIINTFSEDQATFRFTLSNNEANNGFHGQFFSPVFKYGDTIIWDVWNLDEFTPLCNPPPMIIGIPKEIVLVVSQKKYIESEKVKEYVTPIENSFPEEYSISAWFKFDSTPIRPLQLSFRLHQNQGESNTDKENLGDRTLAAFVDDQGNYQLATYSFYVRQSIPDNPNLFKQIQYKDRLTQWHLIFMGYSKAKQQVLGYLQCNGKKEIFGFDFISHYLSQQLFLNIAADKFNTAVNLNVADFRLHLGSGAFNPVIPEFSSYPISVVPALKVSPFSRKCVNGPTQLLDASSSGDKVVDLQISEENLMNVNQYGYGLWSRWLTRWPDALQHGLTENNFLSRLTNNDPYDNINMGDRLLAIWLTFDAYRLISVDAPSNNPNVVQHIPFNMDIEGVWTYIHFSYHPGQAVGITHTDGQTQLSVFTVQHPSIKFLRLMIGGADLKIYPGFNGQISSPVLKYGSGSFVGSVDEFNQFVLTCNPHPDPDCKGKRESKIVDGMKQYDATLTNIQEYIIGSNPFANSYSVRGWFKWMNSQQDEWNFAFRVTINDKKTNRNAELLGDRVLALFIGLDQGGIYHFTTYTYTNMFGAGNANQYQNHLHNQKQKDWHFISFQYTKEIREAYGQIIFSDNSRIEARFSNINHYLTPALNIFVGRDNFCPGYNGQIADFIFSTCSDEYHFSFQPGTLPASIKALLFQKVEEEKNTQSTDKQSSVMPQPQIIENKDIINSILVETSQINESLIISNQADEYRLVGQIIA